MKFKIIQKPKKGLEINPFPTKTISDTAIQPLAIMPNKTNPSFLSIR